MNTQLTSFEFILPPWTGESLGDRYLGAAEVRAFCASADPRDLPDNPSVGVALDWICELSRHKGFVRQLARLGTDHESVMDHIYIPAEQGNIAHLDATHPVILMHLLWRMTVQYGRDGYADMADLIGNEDYLPTRYLWAALLRSIRKTDSPLTFLPCGTEPERGPMVRLGNPNLILDPREMSPGIARVMTDADFTSLPEEPDWGEISDLALIIDDYPVAQDILGIHELFDWFNPLWEAHLNEGAAFPQSSLHLWLMLFACQRGYLRDLWTSENPDGTPSIYAIGIRNVYRALRLAGMDEQANPCPGNPTYIPHPGRGAVG